MTQPAGKKPSSKKPRTEKNLVVRGGIYYFRKVIKGKRYIITTGQKVGGTPEFVLANKRATQIENEINEGTWGFKEKQEAEKPKMTVDEWLGKFIDTLGGRAATTQANYRNMVAHLQKAVDHQGNGWAGRTLESISRSDCEHLLTSARFGTLKSSNSSRTLHGTASLIFQRAVDDKIITSNPWVFKRARVQPCERLLSVAEQQMLWPHLSAYQQRVMLVLLMTGLRVQEFLKLTESDVDFTRRRLHVRKGKGGKSRVVPMVWEVAEAIREHQAAMTNGTHGLPPTAKIGTTLFPCTCTALLKWWYAAADAAGIPFFSSHDLRRTFASRCASSGVPMKQLMEILGHADISVTAQHYVHTQGGNEDALNGMRKTTVEGTQPEVVTKVVTLVPKEANS